MRRFDTRRNSRRVAVGVLAALASAGLAATIEPAAAVPGGGTVAPAVTGHDARPAFTTIVNTPDQAPPRTPQDHGLLVCPPPANYDPTAAQ
jgi:hypothetical protein